MKIEARKFTLQDIADMITIWNEVVEDGSYEDIIPHYYILQ